MVRLWCSDGIVQSRYGVAGVALGNDITGATLAAATLGSNAQFKLDVVKTHTSAGMAGNFAVRNTMADTNNHGEYPIEAGS